MSIYKIAKQVVQGGQYTAEWMNRALLGALLKKELTEAEHEELCGMIQSDPSYREPGDFASAIEELRDGQAAVKSAVEQLSEQSGEQNAMAAALSEVVERERAGLAEITRRAAVNTSGPWSAGGTYLVGDAVTWDSGEYRCIQSHTAQEGWNPTEAPSLWMRMDDPEIEWPVWRLPQGAHDAYALGAKVSHNGKHWMSTADGNVWEPGAIGAESLWTEEVK